MKNRLLMLGLVVGFILAVPTVVLAEGASSGKPLTRIEFGDRFHGLDSKLVDKQYDNYRSGLIPAPTLDSSSMR